MRGPPPVIIAAADYALVLTQIGAVAMGTGICPDSLWSWEDGEGFLLYGGGWGKTTIGSFLGCSSSFSQR